MIPRFVRWLSLAGFLSGSMIGPLGIAQSPPSQSHPAPSNYQPLIAKASNEAQKAISRFRLDPRLQVRVWAVEPLLAHPVALAIDEKGDVYVAETFRHSAGVTDNRGHMYWLDDDLASRTVEDRIAMYRKHLRDRFAQFEKEHDRVRKLVDSKGTGQADVSTVFADGFHRAEEDIGSGLLARQGDVYYTCIPHLWLLRDTKNVGSADVRKPLSSGYGVHVAFIGHDLHGLRIGPDGKLYFSIGDRGFQVKTAEGQTLAYPDTGAVLRCNLDGSQLEVVHVGLRNPQELAFDDFGNLFTVDNNSDSGDRARWVYVVEGGDSGWRIGYQYGSEMGNRGPWNAEKLWHLFHDGQPAYIVPPLAHFADGPSGFTHYPGVGLSERYQGHFFLCDFRGTAGGSGIHAFRPKVQGASFVMTDAHPFLWSILATDCDFGPDCALYVSDWVEGWNKTGKGRIYRVADPQEQAKPIVAEVKKLLAEGFDQRSEADLLALLAHPHQQVRTEAQFALAARGPKVRPQLEAIALQNSSRLARLHAIWGLGMIRGSVPVLPAALLTDADEEVKAQSAKVIGQRADSSHFDALIRLLNDPSLRVRYFAAEALGKLGDRKSFPPLVEQIRNHADRDPYLRHALVVALSKVAAPSQLVPLVNDPSASVRLAAVVALRRQRSPEIARFLKDPDLKVVSEAARAIHDEPIAESLPALAALLMRPGLNESIGFRALNAAFRLGGAEHAQAVAQFAARAAESETLRRTAVKMLQHWADPPRRDYVTGLTQNLGKRAEATGREALRPVVAAIFTGPAKLREETAKAAAAMGLKELGPMMLATVRDAKQSSSTRVQALLALDALRDPTSGEAVTEALASTDVPLRSAARRILAASKPTEVLPQLQAVLAGSNIREKQLTLQLLGDLKHTQADQLLLREFDAALAGKLAPETLLDLLEAAEKRATSVAELRKRLDQYNAQRSKTDDLSAYREALVGGDAERGREIFLNKAAVSCQRCHKLDNVGGEVGPPLNGLGAKYPREYLLEAIVLPSKQIAKGYESVTLTLLNGKTVSGVLRAEDAHEVKLITAEGQMITVKKSDIDDRSAGPSAMPADLMKHLSKRELRDLVEFLANLKTP